MNARRPAAPRLAAFLLTSTLLVPAPALALTFAPPVTIPLGNSTNFAHDVAIADLNHDGHPDLVVVDWVSSVMDVLLAQPGGGFGAVTRFPAAEAPYTVALVDLNGDGNLDAVTGNRSGASVSVFLGDGAGGFAPRVDYPAPAPVSAAVVGDVTGDGKLDVVAAADLRVCVFAGDGAGHLAAPTSTVLGGSLATSQIWGIALGDLDQDGDLDVVANYNGPVVELRNDGSGGFTRFDYGSARIGARHMLISDVTGDGKADVVAAGDVAGGVVVLTGDGSGNLAQQPTLATGGAPWHVALADLDGDGYPDALVPNIADNTISILPGTPTGLGFPNPPIPTQLNPISVAVADLNGDGTLDYVETGYSGNVIIHYQIASGGTGPSSVALDASPSPAAFGADVTLTASVTPSSATGNVDFLDGVTLLGSSLVGPGGVAQLVVHGLGAGFHTLTAHYSGSGTLAPSTSPEIQEEITAAPTTTAIATSPNPAVKGALIRITATITATPPSAIDGFVIFRLDGTLWLRVVVDPETNTATVFSDTLTVPHTLQASYEGTANHRSSVSAVIDQQVVGPEPVIVSLRDVPHDQGGKVTIKWDAPGDAPGSNLIAGYRIWRRAAPGLASSLTAGAPSATYVRMQPPGATQADYYEAIAELPAERLAHYAYTAPTTQDSLPGSNPFTAFFVSALTDNPSVFFHSQVDSGYSVDNLSPPSPAPFAVVYGLAANDLHWSPRPTPDLKEFQVFRGGLIDFEPGPENQIAATRDSALHDARGGSAVYKLIAVDIHGNKSRTLVVTPDIPVGTLAAITGIEALADRIRLRWYSPGGAGSPATVYRREVDTGWERLASSSFDGTGFLVYEDTRVEPGHRYAYRLGIPEGDEESFTAESWTDGLPMPVLAMSIVSGNPSPTGRLQVSLSLPGSEVARLELLDVSGRRVASLDVSAAAGGRQTVTLAPASSLRAGVYVLRLLQGASATMHRVVVVP